MGTKGVGCQSPGIAIYRHGCCSFFPLMKRALSICGLYVLGGLCGMGVAWLIIGAVMMMLPSAKGDELITHSMPWLVAGGVIGFFISIYAGNRIFDSDTSSARFFDRRYFPYVRARTFIAALLLPFALLRLLYQRLEGPLGTAGAVVVEIVLVLLIVWLGQFLFKRNRKKRAAGRNDALPPYFP
jgi:hypothetical protein